MSTRSTQPAWPSMVLRPEQIERFDRGSGVVTIPFVGRWNCTGNQVTTGMTVFAPGTRIPLHSQHVEESVLVHDGEATAVVGDQEFDLVAGQAIRAPVRVRPWRGAGPVRPNDGTVPVSGDQA